LVLLSFFWALLLGALIGVHIVATDDFGALLIPRARIASRFARVR
jgi:hypothetical protein